MSRAIGMHAFGAECLRIPMPQMRLKDVVKSHETRFIPFAQTLDNLDVGWNQLQNALAERIARRLPRDIKRREQYDRTAQRLTRSAEQGIVNRFEPFGRNSILIAANYSCNGSK